MFIAVYLQQPKTGNNKCPSESKWKNCGTSIPQNNASNKNEGAIDAHNNLDESQGYYGQ